MNNSKTTLALAIIAAALFGVVWYLYITHQDSIAIDLSALQSIGSGAVAPVATTTLSASTTTAAPIKTPVKKAPAKVSALPRARVVGVSSLTMLMSQKEPLICTAKTVSALKRSGTIYVSGGRMRGNFTSVMSGVSTKTSMIDDGTSLYAWTVGATKGLQLPASLSAAGSAIASAGGVDLASDLSYTCNLWVEDKSVFVSPATVSFGTAL